MKIQCRFVEYVANDTDERFESWVDAWNAFRESGVYFNVLRDLDTQIKAKETMIAEQKEAAVERAIEAIEQAAANQENAMTEQTATAVAEVETTEVESHVDETHDVETAEVKVPDVVAGVKNKNDVPKFVQDFFRGIDFKTVKKPAQLKGMWDKFTSQHRNELLLTMDCFMQKNIPITPISYQLAQKKNIYDRIQVASRKDGKHRYLDGFMITDDRKQIVATDGCRLLILPYNGNFSAGIWKELKDRKTLDILSAYTYEEYLELWKRVNDKDAPLSDDDPIRKSDIFNMSIMQTNTPLTQDGGKYFSLIDGEYPQYQQVVNLEFTGKLENILDWYSPLRSVVQLHKLLKTYEQSVCIDIGDKYMLLDCNFLLDGMEALAPMGQPITLHYNTEKFCPIHLTAGDALYVLMPMHENRVMCTDCPKGIVVNQLPNAPTTLPAGYVTSKTTTNKGGKNGNGGSGGSKVNPATKAIRTAPTAPVKADKDKAAIAARKPVPVTNDGSLAPTERVLKNLVFKQLMRFGKDVHIDARKDVIHKLFDAGVLAVSEYMDKKGKQHYLVAKQFMGDIAHKYASYLLSGGQKFDFSPVEG